MTEIKQVSPVKTHKVIAENEEKTQPAYDSCGDIFFFSVFVLMILGVLFFSSLSRMFRPPYWSSLMYRNEMGLKFNANANHNYFSYFLMSLIVSIIGMIVVICQQRELIKNWKNASWRPYGIKKWKDLSVTLTVCFVGFLLGAYNVPLPDMESLNLTYQEGYLYLGASELVAIQEQYRCCGRNFYDEEVCRGNRCDSTAILQSCLRQYAFQNPGSNGGCVPKLFEEAKEYFSDARFHQSCLFFGIFLCIYFRYEFFAGSMKKR
jgi:hypothetical protein